jgi:hypothetical protein
LILRERHMVREKSEQSEGPVPRRPPRSNENGGGVVQFEQRKKEWNELHWRENIFLGPSRPVHSQHVLIYSLLARKGGNEL